MPTQGSRPAAERGWCIRGLDVSHDLSYKVQTMSRNAQIFAAEALRAGGVVRVSDKGAKRKR